jgi:hypothetical protein
LAEQLCREDAGFITIEAETKPNIVSVKKVKQVVNVPKEQSKAENQETPIKQKKRIKMRKLGNSQKENSAQLLGSKRLKPESKWN